MNALSNLWRKLTRSKKYREAFVASQLKRGIPTQIRILRKQRRWTQADLAEASGLTQGAISRAEDPDYGNLTFNNILRIAAGFDIAFVGKFVSFSELARWRDNLSEEALQVPNFEEESFDKKATGEEIEALALSYASSVSYSAHTEINIPGESQQIFTAEASNTPLIFHQEEFDFHIKGSTQKTQINNSVANSTEADESMIFDLAA